MGSTLSGSVEKNKHLDTPGFDLPSSKTKINELTVDLREFTLGQREQGSSNQSGKSKKDG